MSDDFNDFEKFLNRGEIKPTVSDKPSFDVGSLIQNLNGGANSADINHISDSSKVGSGEDLQGQTWAKVNSYQLISTLSSGFQGSFVAHKMLLDLEHPSSPAKAVEFSRRMLDRIASWFNDLFKNGTNLIERSWTTPSTEDSKLAFKLLDVLCIEYKEVGDLAALIRGRDSSECSEAEIKWLIAQLGRQAYVIREEAMYLKGRYDLSKSKELGVLAYNQNKLAASLIDSVHGLIHFYKTKQNVDEVKRLAWSRINHLEIFTNLRFHSSKVLSTVYEPEITFHSLGFSSEEAEVWNSVKFKPTVASLWRAYGFLAKEALEWFRHNFYHPQAAMQWSENSFLPKEALEWLVNGVDPESAAKWRDAEFTTEKALVYIKKGLKVPPSMPSAD